LILKARRWCKRSGLAGESAKAAGVKWRALLIVVHGLFFLAACSTVPTLAPEALRSMPADGVSRFFDASSAGHLEANVA